MDWQIIILTLGASFITGAVTLLGNIIISRANIKSKLVENDAKDRHEFIQKRQKAYDDILECINLQLENINCKEKPYEEQKTKIDKVWRSNFHYCGKSVNKNMVFLIKYFDDSFSTKQRITLLSQIMKNDMDRFYGIKDKIYKRKDL